jgi:hypothetical protein
MKSPVPPSPSVAVLLRRTGRRKASSYKASCCNMAFDCRGIARRAAGFCPTPACPAERGVCRLGKKKVCSALSVPLESEANGW